MGDNHKTTRQLIKEIEELRQRNAQLKTLEIERTRTDKVLQERSEKFGFFYGSELIAMYITSIETGRPVDANNKGVHFAGYSSKEKFLAEFVSVNYHTHPEKRKELINELRLKGEVHKKEYKFIKKDGTPLWVEFYAKIHPEKGWIESALIDISERKQLENALKKSQEELEKKVDERTAALKLVNEQLKEAKDHLENILESSLDSIVVTDSTGYITRTNKSFLQLLGYREKELIGKHMAEFSPMKEGSYESTSGELIQINEEIFNATKTSMSILVEKGKMYRAMGYHIRKDNKLVPVEDSMVFLHNKKGERIGALAIIRDITERRKAEKELSEAKEFLENIFRTSIEGIIVSDNTGCITMANEAVEKILGYTEDELKGKCTVELLPRGSKHEERGKELIGALQEKNIITSFEITWIRKDGSFVDVEINASLLRDKEKTVIGSVGSIRDITDRKRAEEKIKETTDYLDNIIESSLDAVVVSDSRGYITRVNKSFFELTGYREKEVIGKHITELTPYEERTYESTSGEMVEIKEFISDAFEVIEKKLFEEGRISNWETYYLRKDRKIIPVETNVAYLYNEEGDAIGSVGINRDITERRRAERKIIEYQNKLRSFASQLTLIEEKERQKFAAFLHDQIGQKLFASKLNMEMLKKSASLKEMVKFSEEIFTLISQIIEDTRNLTFELSPPILHQLGFEPAIEWLTEHMSKQHSIVVDFEDDKREKAIDEDMKILLFQAIRELLTNITKHAQAKKAKVSIKRDETQLRVCVEDDGAGFTPPGKYSSEDKNGGFGLFSIKERLDHLGGHLKITSQPGLGTQVTLIAPLMTKRKN